MTKSKKRIKKKRTGGFEGLMAMLISALLLGTCVLGGKVGIRSGGNNQAKKQQAVQQPAGQAAQQTAQATQPTQQAAQPQQTAAGSQQTAQPQQVAQASQPEASPQQTAQPTQQTAQPEETQQTAQATEPQTAQTDTAQPEEASKQEKSGKSSPGDVAEALQEGYDTLVEVRDSLYAYYHDDGVPANEEIARGINAADELMAKIRRLDAKTLKPQQVADIYDQISDIMDVFAGVKPVPDAKSIDILSLREAVKGSMWIDDEINTYIFDKDGKTMYIALAGDSHPCGGSYEVGFTDEAIRFTFSIPELTTEVKGDITEFTDDSFKFTDVNTGEEFYLTPVNR